MSISSISDILNKLINKNEVFDKSFNYMLFGEKKNKKFKFSPDDEKLLFEMFEKITSTKNEKYFKKYLHFQQRNNDLTIKPLIVDVDMSDSIQNKNRIVNDKMVSEIVEAYGIVLKKIYGESFVKNKDLQLAYVSVRPNETVDESRGVKKDGLHMIFPNIICNNKVQNFIRREILKLAFSEGKELYKFKEERESVIDKNIISTAGWMLYGHNYCKENKEGIREWKPVYKLTHLINSLSGEKMELPESPEKLIRTFSIRNRLPNNDLVIEYKPEEEKKEEKEKTNVIYSLTPSEILFWKDVLENLDSERYYVYEKWIKTALIIASALKKDEKIYEIWADLCDNAEENHSFHTEKQYISVWNKADDRWTQEHLLNILKLDNINSYNKILKKHSEIFKKITEQNIYDTIRNLKSYHDADVAEINCILLRDRFAVDCTEDKTGTVYEFRKKYHIWKKCPNDNALMTAIWTDVWPIWENVYKKLNIDRVTELNSDIENVVTNKTKVTKYDYKIKEIGRVLKEFKSVSKEKNILRFLKIKLSSYRYEFVANLNLNPNLFACSNGILDFSNNKFVFRDGSPDDCISIQSPVKYTPYDPKDEMVKEMHAFFDTVYIDKDIKEFILDIFTLSLIINTWDNRIFICLGEGSNGKSRIFDLIQDVFGYKQYYTNVDGNIFTQKSKANAPAPEKALMKWKRIISVNETDDAPFNTKAILEVSGGSMVAGARKLHENSEDAHFKIHGRLFVQTNKVPEVSGDTANFTRRIRIIPHKTFFCAEDDPKYDKKNKYHKLIDYDMQFKLKTYTEYLLSFLVYNFVNKFLGKKLSVKNLQEPEEVKKATKEYFAEINKFGAFLKNNLVDSNDELPINSLYERYQSWMQEFYSNDKIVDKSKFIKLLEFGLKDKLNKTKTKLLGVSLTEIEVEFL